MATRVQTGKKLMPIEPIKQRIQQVSRGNAVAKKKEEGMAGEKERVCTKSQGMSPDRDSSVLDGTHWRENVCGCHRQDRESKR